VKHYDRSYSLGDILFYWGKVLKLIGVLVNFLTVDSGYWPSLLLEAFWPPKRMALLENELTKAESVFVGAIVVRWPPTIYLPASTIKRKSSITSLYPEIINNISFYYTFHASLTVTCVSVI